MKYKTILLPIEIYPREYKSSILFGAIAALNGFRVVVGSKSAIWDYANKSHSCAVLYKGGMPVDRAQALISKDHKIYILDQELGPAIVSSEEIFKERITLELLPYLSGLFTVGPFISKCYEQYLPWIPRDLIHDSGWSRFDQWQMYRPSNCPVHIDEHVNGRRYILVASDFGLKTESEIKQLVTYLKSVGVEKGSIELSVRTIRKSIKEFIVFADLIRKLSESHLVVFRPHPEDNDEIVKSHFDGSSVVVERSGDITEWLYFSEALVHRGCTTSFQAYLMKKPNYYLTSSEFAVRESITSQCATVVEDVQLGVALKKPYASCNTSNSILDDQFVTRDCSLNILEKICVTDTHMAYGAYDLTRKAIGILYTKTTGNKVSKYWTSNAGKSVLDDFPDIDTDGIRIKQLTKQSLCFEPVSAE